MVGRELARRRGDGFALAVLGLVLVAFGARAWFAVAAAPDLPMPGDAAIYRELADNLAGGRGLSLPGIDSPELQPSAEHPPVFPALLAGLDAVGIDGPGPQRLVLAALSGGGVALVALLGRRLGGPAAGLAAGAIAALHPMWVQHAGLLMSESIYLVLVPGVLLAALAVLERPSWRTAAVLGALIGVAGLVRSEALALAVLVGLPAVALAGQGWRARVRSAAVVVLGAVLVVTPWLVRNQQSVGTWSLSTNAGKTLQGAYCAETFSGPRLGGFSYDCQFGAAAVVLDQGLPDDELDAVALDRALGEIARDFIDARRRDLPKVMIARGLRMWGLGFVDDQRRFDLGESRHPTLQRLGQWVHLGLLPLAVVGAASLVRRRDRRLVLVLGPVVLVTLTGVLTYGGTRLRAGAEPTIAVLAAVGLLAASGWIRGRRAVPPAPAVPGPASPRR
jgi:4-amino-4-deoxy-L-arabinose transferase-like glycosyltransferase